MIELVLPKGIQSGVKQDGVESRVRVHLGSVEVNSLGLKSVRSETLEGKKTWLLQYLW